MISFTYSNDLLEPDKLHVGYSVGFSTKLKTGSFIISPENVFENINQIIKKEMKAVVSGILFQYPKVIVVFNEDTKQLMAEIDKWISRNHDQLSIEAFVADYLQNCHPKLVLLTCKASARYGWAVKVQKLSDYSRKIMSGFNYLGAVGEAKLVTIISKDTNILIT